MPEVDVGSLVPSTRDLLQVLGTRRRSLALVGLLAGDAAAAEAARLDGLNVSAFAALEPGPAMLAGATATKTVPSLCLAPCGSREALQAARHFGADGVCIDASLPLDDWDRLAKLARSMRMLPLALATDRPAVEAAGKAGAKAILIRAATAEAVVEAAAAAPKGTTVVGWVEPLDEAAVRALAKHVDAAVVTPQVHASAGFAALVSEVDP